MPTWDTLNQEYRVQSNRPIRIPCRGKVFVELPINVHVPSGFYGVVNTLVGTPAPTTLVVHLNGKLSITLMNSSERDVIVPRGRNIATIHAEAELIRREESSRSLEREWPGINGRTIVIDTGRIEK